MRECTDDRNTWEIKDVMLSDAAIGLMAQQEDARDYGSDQ